MKPTVTITFFFYHGVTAHCGPRPPQYRGFTMMLRHRILGRTPLYEWSARRRDLYLTTHNIRKRKTSMPPARFEPAIPASERPHTNALGNAATRIGNNQPHNSTKTTTTQQNQQHTATWQSDTNKYSTSWPTTTQQYETTTNKQPYKQQESNNKKQPHNSTQSTTTSTEPNKQACDEHDLHLWRTLRRR